MRRRPRYTAYYARSDRTRTAETLYRNSGRQGLIVTSIRIAIDRLAQSGDRDQGAGYK